jgi:Kef-type K+ transport system membrane component KefB
LLVVAIGALVSPAIGRRLAIPAAVVEILFGVAVARFGGDAAASVPFLRSLADLGFALFLFLAGLEVNAAALLHMGWRAVFSPFLLAVISFGLALIAAVLLDTTPWVALAIGATSVPLLLSVVREAGLQKEALGRRMITAAAIGEILTVALVALAQVAIASTDVGEAIERIVRLLCLVALIFVGARTLGLLGWWFPERAHALLTGDDPAESGVRAGFGLTFGMVGVASLGGIEPLLGAFLGGLMVSFAVTHKEVLERKFAAMAYGFFVPVFFVDVGLRLDLGGGDATERAARVLTLTGLMFVVKLLPQLIWASQWSSIRALVASSLLLAAPLTLVIAIADLAARLGAIDEAMEGALVAAGMLASLVYPSIARRLLS